MRDPLNQQHPEIFTEQKSYITFNSIPEYDKTDYDLNNDKDYNRYILDIKRDSRQSFEYSHLMQFLKEYCDMNKCSFYKNISGSSSRRIKIEIHHDPFTIEDIIRIIAKKRYDLGENWDVPMVAKEVTFIHYNLLVGLIPLSKTVHELVGNGYLFVPTTKVLGKYKEFVNLYYDYITPEQKDILERIEEATKTYDEVEAMKILTKHYIYIDINSDEYRLPSYQSIVDLMREGLNQQQPKEKFLIKPLIKYGETPIIY